MTSDNDVIHPQSVETKQSTEIQATIWKWIKNVWDSVKQTLLIVGAALLFIACARNTCTWYANKLWGASGSFWQKQWEKAFNYFDGDPWMLSLYGTALVSNVTFWLFNAFFLTLDLTGKPQALLKYKIDPDENFPVDMRKFKKAIKVVVFNQNVVGLGVLICFCYAAIRRGCDFGRELPVFQWVLFELAVFSLVEEFGFYYSHRLMHHRALYKHIHKIHHEWTSPIGIRSVYAHPIEHVVSNLLPPLLGPLLMGSHIATTWLWLSVVLFSTTIAHCGYHFPFLPSPEAHDFHHQKFMNNFGVLGILDRLHGTDNLFRKSKAYERHYVVTTLTPVKVLHPDVTKETKGKLDSKLQ